MIGDRGQNAAPQFAARLKHPRFVVNPVSNIDHAPVSIVGKDVQAVETNEFGSAFDQFLRQQLPISPACNDHESIVSPDHTTKPHNAGTKHEASSGPCGRKVPGYDDFFSQLTVDSLARNAPDHRSRTFAELSKCGTVRPFQQAQALNDPECLK